MNVYFVNRLFIVHKLRNLLTREEMFAGFKDRFLSEIKEWLERLDSNSFERKGVCWGGLCVSGEGRRVHVCTLGDLLAKKSAYFQNIDVFLGGKILKIHEGKWTHIQEIIQKKIKCSDAWIKKKSIQYNNSLRKISRRKWTRSYFTGQLRLH